MTKQEKLQESYGKYWVQVKDYVDDNGIIDFSNYKKYLLEFSENMVSYDAKGLFYIPKSIQGIETNNGWIKIESEEDLPTIGEYFTIANFDNTIVEREFPHPKFSLEFNKVWWLKYITHYQPIIKPQSPIY